MSKNISPLGHPDSTYLQDWLDEWKSALQKDPEMVTNDTLMQWWIVQLFMHGYDVGFEAGKKTQGTIVNAYEESMPL